MEYVRRAAERGHVNLGWLNSHHTFSFGYYYDPGHMGLSTLRVLNDDRVAPGAGFETHGHRDMEIISYVLEGAMEHQDSMGNRFVLPAGEVQRMTAGSGILHSEFNASKDKPMRFLQIWIKPDRLGLKPGYQQKRIEQQGWITPLVTPDGDAGSLSIHQNMRLYRLQLKPDERQSLGSGHHAAYLHVFEGDLLLEKTPYESRPMTDGDGFGVQRTEPITLVAGHQGAQALWFELP